MLCQSLSFVTGSKSFSKAQLSHSWRGKGKMYAAVSSVFFSPSSDVSWWGEHHVQGERWWNCIALLIWSRPCRVGADSCISEGLRGTVCVASAAWGLKKVLQEAGLGPGCFLHFLWFYPCRTLLHGWAASLIKTDKKGGPGELPGEQESENEMKSADLLLVKQWLCLCRPWWEMHHRARDAGTRERCPLPHEYPGSHGDFETWMQYVGYLRCRCLQTGASKCPHVWDKWQASRRQWLFCSTFCSTYCPENPEQPHCLLPSTWIFCLRTSSEKWSAVEVAATCAYLFVSVLTSSFLLAVYKAGSFSGAGLLLRKVVLKSVQKDLEESVAEACFHLWVPFGSVHMAWTSKDFLCCQHALGAGGRRTSSRLWLSMGQLLRSLHSISQVPESVAGAQAWIINGDYPSERVGIWLISFIGNPQPELCWATVSLHPCSRWPWVALDDTRDIRDLYGTGSLSWEEPRHTLVKGCGLSTAGRRRPCSSQDSRMANVSIQT